MCLILISSSTIIFILDTIGGETQIKSCPLLKDIGILVSLLGDESSQFDKILPQQTFIFA